MEQSVAKEIFEVRLPEEIKKALEHCRTGVHCAGCPYFGDAIANCWDNLTHDLIVCIQQLEAQQPRWISVGERLPEDDGYVLCHCNDGLPDVVCMYYGGGELFFMPGLNNVTDSVTHWMPLPQPPEEGN